jgi:putative membrane-bound dehydrogenase-like protein
MKSLILFLALLQVASASESLRVFIRSGAKTHAPGCHDYPAFLKDWTALLNERGAKTTGGNEFPSKEQLAETDVVILHASEAGNIKGEDRENFEAYLKRGGGVVAIHGGAVSRDPDWFKTVIGGSWNFGRTKFLEGHMSLYFTDRENPITAGASNFDLDDEIYYDMDMMPEAKILAAAYTPKPKKGDAKPGQPVSVYDIQPQIWSYETGNRRAFVCIPGHVYENFSHTSLQTILLRGIAWAGKLKDADSLLKDKPALDSALRYPIGGPTKPEEAAGKIEVHPEFDISLVASEPLINKVMNVDWDERGRMWVVETPEYPNGLRKVNTDTWKDSGSVEKGKYEREPLDRISILTDTDGDGLMDKKHVFADKLELATSFVLHRNGVIVSVAPDIWFLEDTDGDEVADKRTKLYTGLGTRDTHAVINNLRWGLDGWIYATHGYSAGKVKALGADGQPETGIGSGVVRFKPDGSEIEMFSSKNANTWGLNMTTDGQCFWTQPTSGTILFHTVLPEYVLAKGKIAGTGSFKGMITGQKTFPLMSWEQAAYKQIDQVGSYTAAAGCAIYEGGAWPEKWNYSYFVGEPTINIVSQYFVKPDGVTYSAEKEKGREETEFMRSKDLWFCPIENRVGPDGALYVVDFYNQAVIHNDTRGPLHGPANAAVRPDRDHYFGRIWRIQHKDAKKIDVPVIDKSKTHSLEAAFVSPNSHTRMTAIRLMREAGEKVEIENGSAALKTYREFEGVDSPDGRAKLISTFAAAQDDWTRSALIAAGSGQATDLVSDCLASADAEKLTALVTNLLPKALETDPSASAGKLIIAVSAAPAAADPLKAAIVDVIAGTPSAKPPLTPELSAALAKLVANPATASKMLPLIARWDTKGTMSVVLEKQVGQFSEKLEDTKAAIEERIAAARALISVGTDDSVARALWILQDAQEPIELQSAIIAALGDANFAAKIAMLFDELSPGIRNVAFDEIVKLPAAAMALLGAVDTGNMDAKNISPGDIARLRSHPDKGVSRKANAIMDKLRPGAKEKEEIIKAFLPVVTKPGDVANGKMLFTAACAVCHKFGDVGKADVGPALTGMGAHGAAELLVHVVDPNREVDPSFWQWNITTKDGKTLAGVITSENQATINLRNQGGDTEIRKDSIASRVNTRRSLMPEGLDGLGAENIRDILAYMNSTATGRYRVIDLRRAYAADARRGLFANEDATKDSVFPKAYGDVQAMGIPFYLMDPEKSPDGRSLIVLKGGHGKNAAQKHPQKVTVKTDVAATRLHLISGIAGWGFPATPDAKPAMKVTLTHKDGATETTELLNKRDFVDYNREIEAPGSKLLKGIVSWGQLRLITIDVKKPGPVTSITLESYDNGIAPVVMAITADLSDRSADEDKTSSVPLSDLPPGSTSATGQKFREPRAQGATRVLIVGAGSSHHFPRDFIKADTEILSEIPGADVIGTMNLAEALEAMPKADVLVFSGNHDQWGTKEFQKALNDFADAGKGIVLLHAATWSHPWEGYNKRFVTGGTKGHGKGTVAADCIRPAKHPILNGVPESFTIEDESYHFKFQKDAKSTVLIENKPDGKSPDAHPALWIVSDPKARIVCYTHGHDDKSHANPAYKTIITNAVKWLSSKN